MALTSTDIETSLRSHPGSSGSSLFLDFFRHFYPEKNSFVTMLESLLLPMVLRRTFKRCVGETSASFELKDAAEHFSTGAWVSRALGAESAAGVHIF